MTPVLKYAFCKEGGPWPEGVPYRTDQDIRGRVLVEVTERNSRMAPGLNIWYLDHEWDGCVPI